MRVMREVHLRSLDLNLLQPLYELLKERHVTRAAERSFLSQPAMSRALERLREMFGDPLLVRSGRGYERTARGERVLQELESLVPRLEAMVRGEIFDPAQSRERFRVALTDNACAILLPAFMERVRKIAPHVKIEVSAWRPQSYDDVLAARIDAALSAEEAPTTLETAVLFNLDFVCLVGSRLRVPKRRFTLGQYLECWHVLVETWDGQQTLVDRPLAQLGVKRRVALSLPFFVPFSIARTDLVLTVPRKLARFVATLPGIRLVEPPAAIKPFPYFMAWHPRVASEPAHIWFREQLRIAGRTL
jgi:DNA-binding transcriptional LysR family regulator